MPGSARSRRSAAPVENAELVGADVGPYLWLRGLSENVDIARDWSAVIFEESEQTLGAERGRTLGYAEWGDPSGIPLAAATYVSRTIPGASLTVFPDEGHFFILKHWGEIIRQLTDAAGEV